jgi:hypothetical protein
MAAAALPDCRTGENFLYFIADIGLSAFSVFFTQCPSFLSYQQAMELSRGRNNASSLFQIQRIPCDNHIRQMLDPVEPSHFFCLFDDRHQAFDQTGVLEAMRAVGGTRLVALDATWYFSSSSKNIHCPNCSHIEHANGQLTHYHSTITPVIVSPGHSQVVPLRPEFITPQDGHEKQDCEIAAAKCWLQAHAQRYSTGNDTLRGDDLYAHQPFCRHVLLHNFHFFFICKPTSHSYLYKWVEALEAGRDLHTIKALSKGNRWEHHRYQWANGLLLYRNSYITDWVHTLLELADENYRLIRDTVGARLRFFQHLEALNTYLQFESWERLMDFMMQGLEKGPYATQKS